jgi:deazaflavin-dependent oxidoreductase (nitroreductase family)
MQAGVFGSFDCRCFRTKLYSMQNLDVLAALNVLYLTTTGRVSGLPRTIEIWFVAHQQDLYLLAEHQEAHWVKNLRNNPMVHVRIGGNDMDARARILDLGLDPDLADGPGSRDGKVWLGGRPARAAYSDLMGGSKNENRSANRDPGKRRRALRRRPSTLHKTSNLSHNLMRVFRGVFYGGVAAQKQLGWLVGVAS